MRYARTELLVFLDENQIPRVLTIMLLRMHTWSRTWISRKIQLIKIWELHRSKLFFSTWRFLRLGFYDIAWSILRPASRTLTRNVVVSRVGSECRRHGGVHVADNGNVTPNATVLSLANVISANSTLRIMAFGRDGGGGGQMKRLIRKTRARIALLITAIKAKSRAFSRGARPPHTWRRKTQFARPLWWDTYLT